MEKYLGVLKSGPLFAGLGDSEILSALKTSEARVIKRGAGEYILRVGDKTSVMGLVLAGEVMVIQEDIWGHRNIISKISAGDIFAETFAAVGSAVSVSVAAETECEIMLLNMGRLLSAEGESACPPKVMRSLIRVLARKNITLNDKVTHISKRATKDKLLSFLSAEAVKQGALTFDIPYNRQQLADYLCVDRAAMSVELSRLQKEGLLRYDKNHFELKELAEL